MEELELEKQIELTTEVIEKNVYKYQFINNDTNLILKNQLVIMNTLKEILDKL